MNKEQLQTMISLMRNAIHEVFKNNDNKDDIQSKIESKIKFYENLMLKYYQEDIPLDEVAETEPPLIQQCWTMPTINLNDGLPSDLYNDDDWGPPPSPTEGW